MKKLVKVAARLFKLSWSHKPRLMSCAAVMVLVVSMMPFLQSFALGRLLDSLVARDGRFMFFLSLLLATGCLFAVANTVQFALKTVLYKELFQFLTVVIHRRVARLQIKTHENPEKKDLITKVQDNAMWRAPDFMQRMVYLTQNALEVTAAVLVMLSINVYLGLLVLVCSVPRFIVDARYNDELWRAETAASERRRKFWYCRYFLVELRALLELKLFQTVDFFVEQLGGHLDAIRKREVEVEWRNLKRQLGCVLVSEMGAVTTVIVLVLKAAQSEIQIGSLAFFLGSLATMRLALNSLSQNVGSQLRDGKFVSDMFEVFDLESDDEGCSSEAVASIGEVEFRNVSFAYPGTDRLVLDGVSFKLREGQTLGIVAENGAGKSTLAKLLCRIYEPSSGQILVNGRDIRELDMEAWRSTVGVMLQEYSHYEHLEIDTAVRLGRINNGKMPGEVEEASKRGDAHDFIMGLPRGYETTLGRAFAGGVELSGGQYQKLAISRMFYRNPRIAIFDEPTSSIDGQAEARIFEQILGSLPECTKFLISHRYYTLRKADLICVLESGRVVEFGSHDELMAHQGIYASRYQAQAAEYN